MEMVWNVGNIAFLITQFLSSVALKENISISELVPGVDPLPSTSTNNTNGIEIYQIRLWRISGGMVQTRGNIQNNSRAFEITILYSLSKRK